MLHPEVEPTKQAPGDSQAFMAFCMVATLVLGALLGGIVGYSAAATDGTDWKSGEEFGRRMERYDAETKASEVRTCVFRANDNYNPNEDGEMIMIRVERCTDPNRPRSVH